MTEVGAQRVLVAAVAVSTFAAVVALALGLQGQQSVAAIFLGFALLGYAVAWLAYRRYAAARSERWQHELAASEEEMRRTLNEVVSTNASQSIDIETQGEQPVARP